MHVPKLLDAFLRTGDVEIVKPLLLDRPRTGPAVVQQFCEALFDNFHRHGRISHLRLCHEEMEMLGHHHVPDHDKTIPLPGALQYPQE